MVDKIHPMIAGSDPENRKTQKTSTRRINFAIPEFTRRRRNTKWRRGRDLNPGPSGDSAR